jgi:cobalt/nickel transport system ATP-binding protein
VSHDQVGRGHDPAEHIHTGHDHDPAGHDHDPAAPGHAPAASDHVPAPVPVGAIAIRHLHFAYADGTEALRGIDLDVRPGEKVALVGPNGAGKSTLLLHLNGILGGGHGEVSIDGTVVGPASVQRIRSAVGLVFQDPDDQLFSPTIGEDVAFGPLNMGLPADEVHHRVEAALAAVGMSRTERRVPHHLSLGQRKRVSLATVLAMDPAVLVFDEPTSGLDPRGRREIMAVLRERSETLLVSSHDLAMVAEVLPRMVILDDGRVVADGPTDVLLADAPLLEAHGLESPCR